MWFHISEDGRPIFEGTPKFDSNIDLTWVDKIHDFVFGEED